MKIPKEKPIHRQMQIVGKGRRWLIPKLRQSSLKCDSYKISHYIAGTFKEPGTLRISLFNFEIHWRKLYFRISVVGSHSSFIHFLWKSFYFSPPPSLPPSLLLSISPQRNGLGRQIVFAFSGCILQFSLLNMQIYMSTHIVLRQISFLWHTSEVPSVSLLQFHKD